MLTALYFSFISFYSIFFASFQFWCCIFAVGMCTLLHICGQLWHDNGSNSNAVTQCSNSTHIHFIVTIGQQFSFYVTFVTSVSFFIYKHRFRISREKYTVSSLPSAYESLKGFVLHFRLSTVSFSVLISSFLHFLFVFFSCERLFVNFRSNFRVDNGVKSLFHVNQAIKEIVNEYVYCNRGQTTE